jgi:hypothetical protein
MPPLKRRQPKLPPPLRRRLDEEEREGLDFAERLELLDRFDVLFDALLGPAETVDGRSSRPTTMSSAGRLPFPPKVGSLRSSSLALCAIRLPVVSRPLRRRPEWTVDVAN